MVFTIFSSVQETIIASSGIYSEIFQFIGGPQTLPLALLGKMICVKAVLVCICDSLVWFGFKLITKMFIEKSNKVTGSSKILEREKQISDINHCQRRQRSRCRRRFLNFDTV